MRRTRHPFVMNGEVFIMETKKLAFKMKLKPGCRDEYKKRHDEIWPDLVQLLKESGVSDYSIFLDEETDTLFAVQIQSGNTGSQDLGSLEIVKKWWRFMAPLMETNPDFAPVSVPLPLMFHME